MFFKDLEESLAREHYRQLRQEATIERLLKANKSPRKKFWQQLLVKLGDVLISMGGRLKQEVKGQTPCVQGLKTGAKGQ